MLVKWFLVDMRIENSACDVRRMASNSGFVMLKAKF